MQKEYSTRCHMWGELCLSFFEETLVVYHSPGLSPLQDDVGKGAKGCLCATSSSLQSPGTWAGSCSTDRKPGYDKVLVISDLIALCHTNAALYQPAWRGTAVLAQCRSWPFYERVLCSAASPVVQFRRTNLHQFCFLYILYGPLSV